MVSRSRPVSCFQTWRTTSTMPSRNRVAGGVEPLDFAAADEAVGELVEVVGGEDDDGLGGELFEAVEPHDFGLRGHAVGFVDDDDFPAAAAHRAEVHAPQEVFDGAAVLGAAGDLDDAAPVGVAAEFVGQRPGGGGFADAAGAGEDEGVGMRGGGEGGEAADDGGLAVDVR